MTLKTILACFTDETGAEGLARAACALARRHDAHLIGVHTVETLMSYPGIAVHMPDAVYEIYGDAQMAQNAKLKAVFDRHTQNEDFVAEWRVLRSDLETGAERIVETARCVDIVLLSAAQGDEDKPAQLKLSEAVIRDAGRPVISVPHTFDGDVLGESVMIGWNGTREAARAAHDALALLRDGDSVQILRVNDSSFDALNDPASTDLAAGLARYGIETTLVQRTWSHGGVAEALDKEAFEAGADLIAVGAFGHSRAYDLVIGGATRDLLRHAKLPVMFSR
ncbi:universal stress protein [uncultured Sulfitobacter sp.]|uniref:universal stress protein n=1 Tax=uncultured Sulfitobacter sp. TaxID=191468 RepID=UPI00261BCAC9|nr:universal stress protein [uncultured Sulfitobacter sp.]